MTVKRPWLLVVALFILAAAVVDAIGPSHQAAQTPPTAAPSSPTPPTSQPSPVTSPPTSAPRQSDPNALCHARTGPLPDPTCTPGAIDPSVTQANIASTICARGWTATRRPPVTYTEPIKRKLVRAYGYRDTRLGHYELDHLVPIELGGDPVAMANLWPEPGATPNAKDGVESHLRAQVCAGRELLATAQRAIARDWRTAR